MPRQGPLMLLLVYTLVYLHIRDRLPFVHSNEPSWLLAVFLLSATAQVYDKLSFITAQRRENSVQTRLAEVCLGEEIGCDDDLLIPIAIVSPTSSSLHILLYFSTEKSQGRGNKASSYLIRPLFDPLRSILIRDSTADL